MARQWWSHARRLAELLYTQGGYSGFRCIRSAGRLACAKRQHEFRLAVARRNRSAGFAAAAARVGFTGSSDFDLWEGSQVKANSGVRIQVSPDVEWCRSRLAFDGLVCGVEGQFRDTHVKRLAELQAQGSGQGSIPRGKEQGKRGMGLGKQGNGNGIRGTG